MPNWCTANISVSGRKKELQQFADIVNSLRGKQHVAENDFGDYWLANLAVALGVVILDAGKTATNAFPGNLRGVIDPNPYAEPCLSIGIPEKENDEDTLHMEPVGGEENAILAFSTTSAWSMPDWLLAYLEKAIPGCKIEYKATDDCGNFFECTPGWSSGVYNIGGDVFDTSEYFDKGDERNFIKHIQTAVELGCTADEILAMPDWRKFLDETLASYRHEHKNAFIWWEIYQDVSPAAQPNN